MRFENAFVSQAICWVSRTTILTGLTGRSYGTPGAHDQARPDAVATLYSDLLREHGYRTGYFGKWHAKMPKGYRQADHFDEFEAIGRNPYYKKQPDGSLRHETEIIVDGGSSSSKPSRRESRLRSIFGSTPATRRTVTAARESGISHGRAGVDGMYEEIEMAAPRLNDPAIFEAQPDFLKNDDQPRTLLLALEYRGEVPDEHARLLPDGQRHRRAIGRFVEALEEAGLADNTIIVYSADNGYHMGNRGFAGKWSHYEESLRVPLIIADPRAPEAGRGKSTDALALNLDLPATFLDWAGVEIPGALSGSEPEATDRRAGSPKTGEKRRSTSTSLYASASPHSRGCATSSSNTCAISTRGTTNSCTT